MKSQSFPFIGRYHLGWAIFWALAVLLVFGLATGMNEAIRNFPFNMMFVFGLIAFFSGWVMSGTKNRSKITLIGGLFIGLILLKMSNSGADRNLYLAFVNGFRLNRLFEPFGLYLFDLELFIYFFQNSISNLIEFSKEMFVWLIDLINGQTSFEPKFTEIFWGAILWSATFSSGWLYRRKKHAFIASLPILTLLIGILGYTRQSTSGLTLGMGALLLIIVILEHLRYENKWDSNTIDYSDQLRLEIAFISVPIIFAILLVAYILPNIPYEAIKELYNRTILIEDQNQNNIDRYLGLQKTPQDLSYQEPSGILPRELLIGTGAELSEELVMEISTGEVFLPPGIDIDRTPPRYYWFGRSFDIYTGNGWKTSEFYQKNYVENELIESTDLTRSRLINLEVRKARTAPKTLYASGVPQSVNHRVTTFWRATTNEYYSAQIDALEYKVQSPILTVTEEELRRSAGEVPEEILETYLQIPEGTPDRIYNLALTITGGTHNPYEKVKAIETYLRQFEYTLDVPKPNPELDVVDFFLFDLQKGYCDYFASAMVMLSRSVGLPARLAVGYTTGMYDFTRNVFVVSEANAHAWPEIYFPTYGWVPFEPTTSQTPFSWYVDQNFPTTIEDENNQDELINQRIPFWKNFLILIGIITVMIIIGSIWYIITFQRTKTVPKSQQIEQIYQKMKRQITSFFFPPHSSKTPLEFQKDLVHHLNKQESSRLMAGLADSITNNLRIITEIYIQCIYSPIPISNKEIKIARKNLNELLPRAWLVNFFYIFKKY